MINLDDISAVKTQDPLNVLGSIELLPKQCEQAWNEVNELEIPQEYQKINKIVFSAMGGSALGAYIIKDLFFDKLKYPFEIINDYSLPNFVDKSTLVVLASYSGTTEETINCAYQSIKNGYKSFILSTGGELTKLAKQHKIPSYIFKPTFNPSNQPRLGTGYSVFGQIALLNKLSVLNLCQDEVSETINILEKNNKLYGLGVAVSKNPAKKLALNLINKIPIIVMAEHLIGVGRVVRNQLHESAKNFADYYPIPELNHHLMEALRFPKSNQKNLVFLFLISNLYRNKILKRFDITVEVVKKNGLKVYNFRPYSKNKLTQVFETVHFGAYMNYYLGMLNGVDPSKIPWVDYFKKRLSE